MKISSAPVAAPNPLTYGRIGQSGPAVSRTGMSSTAGAAVQVEASGFLSQLTQAARTSPYGEVRSDKVAAARADIAAGRLGTPADIEQTVNAFLSAML